MSSRSRSLRRGRMMVLIPARRAASTFSLMPPTGSTLPRSVISPVIARSDLHGRPVSSEASDAAMVTPADGPSLGIAPAGTWTWMSDLSKKSGWIPRRSARERTYDSAACADSFITSPSEPVRVRPFCPGIRVLSMNRMSPPLGGPGQAGCDAGVLGPLGDFGEESRRAEIACTSAGQNLGGRLLALGDRARDLAADARRSRARGCATPPRACSCAMISEIACGANSMVRDRPGRSR